MLRFILGALLAALLLARPAAGEERWYALLLNDTQAGWAMERRTERDGLVDSMTQMEINLSRLGQPLKLSMVSRFTETPEGEPVMMSFSQSSGVNRIADSWSFGKDGVLHSSGWGCREMRTVERPAGDWITPARASRLIEDAIAAGKETVTFRTLDPASGLQVVEQTVRIIGRTTVRAHGKTVPAIEWEVSQSTLPGVVTREFVDETGRTIRSEIDLGGISVTVVASDKEAAMLPAEAPELMAQTLVTPSRPIPLPRETTRAVYILSRSDKRAMGDLPSEGAQGVERIDGGRLRITIDRTLPVRPDAEADAQRYLVSTTMARAVDPCIVAFVERALQGTDADDAAARAEALRRAVHTYILSKSLDIGFATASEVCVAREGDCTEHAVLLVAALRAAGIPARAVSGLVYVEGMAEKGVFGFHMWAQALIEGAWVDLDATMPGGRAADATHIALSTSALTPEEGVNMIAYMAPLLGTLEIEVVEVR